MNENSTSVNTNLDKKNKNILHQPKVVIKFIYKRIYYWNNIVAIIIVVAILINNSIEAEKQAEARSEYFRICKNISSSFINSRN
ncbi:MAG: hypothetical protein V8S33_14830 [Intestinibacter bartlettii]